MDRKELKTKLKGLQVELQQTEKLDDIQRAALESLALDVQEILDKADDETHDFGGFGERLNDAVAKFEASHPRATLAMREVIDHLAFLGI